MKLQAAMGAALAILVGCATNAVSASRNPVLHLAVKRVGPANPADPARFIVTLIPEEKGKNVLVTKLIVRDSEWVGMIPTKKDSHMQSDVLHVRVLNDERDWLSAGTFISSGQILILCCKGREDAKIEFALRSYHLREGVLRSSIHLDTTVAEGEILAVDGQGRRVTPQPDPMSRLESRKDEDHAAKPVEEGKQLTIRELGADGRVSVRQVHPGQLLREMETRVFRLRNIQAPYSWTNIKPGARIEEWELYAVIDALLTRDIVGKKLAFLLFDGRKLGALDFDAQTACFIVRDTLPVLDRIEEVLNSVDPDPVPHRLRELLNAREAEERAALRPQAPETAGKIRERGHLKFGGIPELLKKAHAAVATLKPGEDQREALRTPLVELKEEIERLHRDP